MSGSPGCSPCSRIRWKKARRGGSTEGVDLRWSGNGGQRHRWSIRPRKGVDWARGKAEEMRGEARRVGVRGIEKGQRGLAGANAGGEALLGLARPEREDEVEEVGKSGLATGTL